MKLLSLSVFLLAAALVTAVPADSGGGGHDSDKPHSAKHKKNGDKCDKGKHDQCGRHSFCEEPSFFGKLLFRSPKCAPFAGMTAGESCGQDNPPFCGKGLTCTKAGGFIIKAFSCEQLPDGDDKKSKLAEKKEKMKAFMDANKKTVKRKHDGDGTKHDGGGGPPGDAPKDGAPPADAPKDGAPPADAPKDGAPPPGGDQNPPPGGPPAGGPPPGGDQNPPPGGPPPGGDQNPPPGGPPAGGDQNPPAGGPPPG